MACYFSESYRKAYQNCTSAANPSPLSLLLCQPPQTQCWNKNRLTSRAAPHHNMSLVPTPATPATAVRCRLAAVTMLCSLYLINLHNNKVTISIVHIADPSNCPLLSFSAATKVHCRRGTNMDSLILMGVSTGGPAPQTSPSRHSLSAETCPCWEITRCIIWRDKSQQAASNSNTASTPPALVTALILNWYLT